jgi:HEAT repeat protein
MIMRYLNLVSLAAVVFVSLAVPSHAQETPGQRAARLAADAERALSSGRPADAIRLADVLLAESPRDRAAVQIKIRALVSTGDVAGARAAYEQHATLVNREDGGLLKPIAVGELRSAAAGAGIDLALRISALERLAAGGEAGFADELRVISIDYAGQGAGVLADAALARLGDGTATSRLGRAALSNGIPDKAIVAEAIQSAGATDQATALIQLLEDPNPNARAAAADALGALGCREAVASLRVRLSDEQPTVRVRAAVALKRLGDSAGDALVAAMLKSPAPDARLAALEVSPSVTPAERAAIIDAAITDQDPLNRIKGAAMLAKDDPAAARSVLLSLIDNADLTVRRDAARVFDTLGTGDLRLLRGLMASKDGWTRAYAAGRVLAATRDMK